MPTPEDLHDQALATALRSATAGAICLALSAWFQLPMGYLSVFTAQVVNLNYANTPFQKSIERIVGRFLGVFYATVLVVFLREQPGLCLALVSMAMVATWYVQGSGHFAYGVFLAGVFMSNTLAVSLEAPPSAAIETFHGTIIQVLLGVFVAEMVNFGTGAEQSLAIADPSQQPLLPVRADWLNRAIMLTVSAFTAMFAATLAGLSAGPTVITTVILGAAPDPATFRQKSFLRGLAVVVGIVYAVVVLIVMSRLTIFPLLVLFLFLGMFVGTYVAQVRPSLNYLGVQVGIVLAQVLVVPASEVADLGKAYQRFVGVLSGFAIAFVFQLLWPALPPPKPIMAPEKEEVIHEGTRSDTNQECVS